MSGALQPALFFLTHPDMRSLCSVTLSLADDGDEPRSKQIRTCRELVLLFSDVLASPALDSFSDITAVMAIQFFQKGILQGFVQRHNLQMSPPELVFPGVLQYCLSFSLISRLSPNWNKAGLYLVYGKDFLSERGRLSAVSLGFSISEGRVCLSLEANTVRLPPATLQDFDLAPLVLTRFCADPDGVLDPHSTGGPVWCHVLPSMKKGQIMSISRRLPKDGPFKSYRDLQSHWNRLYGYRLPELREDQTVYCNVYFKLLGQRLFTYPLNCIRLAPVQCFPRVDLQGVLSCFMSDVRDRLPSICGFPTRITSRASFTATGLNPASRQSVSREQLNLSDSSSFRPVLSQLPPPPSSTRLMKPFFGSQPAPAATLSSAISTPSFSDLFKPASSPNPFFSVFESAAPPPPLPPREEKLVPIFKNKQPSRHINVALLRAQKENENGERITFPTSSIQGQKIVPQFSEGSAKLKRILTLSPEKKSRPALKPALVLTSETLEAKEVKSKPVFNLHETDKSGKTGTEKTNRSKKREDKSKAEKEVDVEKMARNNQLWKLSARTLLLWLRARGVQVGTKRGKDQLMLRVMKYLAEA